jgi:ribosomal-protein-alanine N-acetyltransferase
MLASAFETGRFNVYGAEIEKCLVGIISFSVTIDTADLEDVFVLPSFRRKKIADDLFNAMEENLSALNVQKLFLEVRKSNFPAISFYQKKGMKKISERKKYYSDGEDAIVFVKEY